MKRTTKAEFAAMLETVKAATATERRSVAYYAALAYQRQRYGTYVYVRANSPDYPTILSVYVGPWGQSGNKYHSEVLVSAGKAHFGPVRCRALIEAAC